LILLLQAFLFYAPCGVWRRVGDNSGIDVGNLIESGQLIASVQMEKNVRKKIVRKMVTQVNRSELRQVCVTVRHTTQAVFVEKLDNRAKNTNPLYPMPSTSMRPVNRPVNNVLFSGRFLCSLCAHCVVFIFSSIPLLWPSIHIHT